jgi:hypothetical protein
MDLPALAARLPLELMAEAEYSTRPTEERRAIRTILGAMRHAAQTQPNVGAAVAAFGAAMGWSVPTARRYWDRIRKQGWKGALDRRKHRRQETDVSRRPEFIAFYRELCDKHQRSLRAAWHDLITLYKAGEQIPGYAEYAGRPPADPLTGLPKGWTYGNLMHFAPTPQERRLARIGPKAFAGATTALWTTRVGLDCGQVFQIDDVWHDHDVYFGKRLCRPLELGMIDVFSTRRVLYGLCPRIRANDDSATRENLKERHAIFLVLAQLMDVGYCAAGCTIIAEHGTAAIREPLAQRLFDASGRRIRVEVSGIADKPAVLGWWAGAGGGNPRMKAVIESLHNYYHNRLGLLPAQTGSNSRTTKPEQLAAIEKYSEQLARELEHFTPAQVDQLLGLLKLPGLTFAQFHGLLDKFYTVIDSRHEHDLEGWDRAGLVRVQWRLNPASTDWADADGLTALPPEQYAVARALLDSDARLMRPYRMSPLEVWTERAGRLTRLPRHTLHQILGDEFGFEVTLRSHRFEFSDPEIDPDGLRYEGTVTDAFGRRILLEDGQTYQAFLNPLAPALLHLCDAKGGYVGAALRIARAPRVDREAIFRAIGAEAGRQNERMAAFRARHEGDAAEHQAMLRHNEQVLHVAAALQAGRDPAATGDGISPAEGNTPANVTNDLARRAARIREQEQAVL